MKNRWNIALGFYQNEKIARGVLQKLKAAGLKRSVYIHREHYGKISVKGHGLALSLLISIGLLTAFFLSLILLSNLSVYLALPIFAVSGAAIIGCCLDAFYLSSVNSSIVNKFKRLVISDETLIIVQVHSQDVQRTLSILRHVESGHPTSFLLRSKIDPQEKDELLEVKAADFHEPLTSDALNEHARELAASLKDVGRKKSRKVLLLKNLSQCEKSLNEIRHFVAEAEFVEQTVTISAEWLLDNTYVIQGNIEEVRRNLPEKFYHELPKILHGPLAGIPRIYVIAKDLVYSTVNRLTRENIIAYINSYQSIDQLTIGELWVLPLMLRLRLIECLNVLSLDIDRRLREGEYACFWGNRLLNVSRREPGRLKNFLDELQQDEKHPSSHFAEELLDHLYDEDKIIPLVRGWLEENLRNDIHEIIKQEQLQKTNEQISLSNAIVSLITLSQTILAGYF